MLSQRFLSVGRMGQKVDWQFAEPASENIDRMEHRVVGHWWEA